MSSSSGTSGLPIRTSTSAGAAEMPCSFRTRRMPGLSTLSEWLNGEWGVARMSARKCGGRTPIDGKKWADRRRKPFSLPSSVARHVTTSTPRVLPPTSFPPCTHGALWKVAVASDLGFGIRRHRLAPTSVLVWDVVLVVASPVCLREITMLEWLPHKMIFVVCPRARD